MSAIISRRTLRIPAVLLGLVAVGLLPPARAWALSPASPEVQRAVARAQEFLVKTRPSVAGGSKGIGIQALVGLALYKSSLALQSSNISADHPRIQEAISVVRKGIRSGEAGKNYESVYGTGLCIIFLSALKDPQYREDIEAALKILLSFQRTHGGFASVEGSANGDTSMTQYAVLGMWEAAHAGVAVPAPAWQGATNWLLATQLKDGSFIYNPPRAGRATSSMAAGGAGSLYICANYVRKANAQAPRERPKGKKGLPSALEPVRKIKKKEDQATRMVRVNVDAGRLEDGLSRADGWLEKNFTVSPREWPLYYLYALERYYAFREDWEKEYPKEPQWYVKGARELTRHQSANGAFAMGFSEPAVATSFAVLFLIRSTRLSLVTQETAGGTLLSGSGLPADLSQIRVKGGEVVVKPLAGPASELLDIMEDPDDPRFAQAVEGFGELVIKADDIMVSKHLLAIKKLAKDGTPAARAKAVEALGKTRNLDHVPTLIYALADDHPRVVRTARDALRFVSRKFDGFGLSPDDEPAEKNKAIEAWKNWYRTVRPEAEFED